jgi:hypothetical protein
MKNEMMPIQFPPNFEGLLDNWRSCPDENVGGCLLCDSPIRTAQDLIPNQQHSQLQGGSQAGTPWDGTRKVDGQQSAAMTRRPKRTIPPSQLHFHSIAHAATQISLGPGDLLPKH